MSLLAPLFLAGLIALAVPVLIHLTQKTKKEPVPFPSLMFLSKVPFKTTRRQQIRNWLIFLLRSAAILILVVAFARPWLRGSLASAAALERAREVVILLDRSYSMALDNRFDRALDAAREVAGGLGPDDRASLVLFSDRAEIAYQPMDDPSALAAAINRVEVGNGTTRFGPALSLAEQILEESELARREAVLISDFQNSGWGSEEDVLLPDGATLRAVDVGEGERENLAVVGVDLDREFRGGRERITALARIANFGGEAADEVDISIEIDGQPIESRTVSVGENIGATVRFSEFTPPNRDVIGAVRISGDELPLDDVFHFALAPGRNISVLILEHPNATENESLFLERALGIGSEPPYRVTRRRSAQLSASDLANTDIVLLNDAAPPRGTGGDRLRQFVLNGGGLFIALGQRARGGSWPEELADILPGRVGAVVDRLEDRGATLSVTDFDHPLLELFSTPRSGDFSRTRFFRYRRLEDTGDAEVLARFDDGAVALAENRAGEGRVLVWTSGLANSWNDFPLQPVFLPFVHQLGRYLARYEPDRLWFTAGEVVDLTEYPRVFAARTRPIAGGVGEAGIEFVVEHPSGERRVLNTGSDERYLPLEEKGVYRVWRLDDESRVGTLAVNVNPVESDLSTIDPEELVGAVTTAGSGARTNTLAATLTPAERERRQGLWWYLLTAALLVLVVETVLSNRSTKKVR